MRETMSRTRQVGLLGPVVLLLSVLVTPGCMAGGSIHSQVLDAQTNQPIPGAIVLGVWTKKVGFPGLDWSELVGVREAEVDAEGHFTLERPSASYGEESVTIYKFGYVAWNNQFVFPSFGRRPKDDIPPQVRLDAFPPGRKHQEHMGFIRMAVSSRAFGSPGYEKLRNAFDREQQMP